MFVFNSFEYFLRHQTIAKQLKLDAENKVAAVEKGFLPFFHPLTLKKEIVDDIEFIPIGSLPLTKTFLCDEGYGLITYKSDRFGLRNSEKKWQNVYQKENIFLIGDSFTHGACVENNNTIASYIEQFSGKNTINLGVSGNGPYEYMSSINLLIKPIINKANKQNIVILNFYINDDIKPNLIDENIIKKSTSIISTSSNKNIKPDRHYISNIKKLISENFPSSKEKIIEKININNKRNWWERNWYQKITLLKVRKRILMLLNNKKISTSQTYTPNSPSEKSIKLLSQVCQKSCKPLIVYIPPSSYWFEYRLSDEYKNLLKNSASRNGVKFVDGSQAINSSDKKNYAPNGPHLSIEGYEKVSKLISDAIKDF